MLAAYVSMLIHVASMFVIAFSACMSCLGCPVGWLTFWLLRSLVAWIGSAAHWVHSTPGVT